MRYSADIQSLSRYQRRWHICPILLQPNERNQVIVHTSNGQGCLICLNGKHVKMRKMARWDSIKPGTCIMFPLRAFNKPNVKALTKSKRKFELSSGHRTTERQRDDNGGIQNANTPNKWWKLCFYVHWYCLYQIQIGNVAPDEPY